MGLRALLYRRTPRFVAAALPYRAATNGLRPAERGAVDGGCCRTSHESHADLTATRHAGRCKVARLRLLGHRPAMWFAFLGMLCPGHKAPIYRAASQLFSLEAGMRGLRPLVAWPVKDVRCLPVPSIFRQDVLLIGGLMRNVAGHA